MNAMLRVPIAALTLLLSLGLQACDDRRPERPAPAATGDRPAGPERPEPPVRERRVQESRLAGSWYDSDPRQLRGALDGYFREARDAELEGVCGLILPHAGYRWSGPTAAEGVAQVRRRKFERVIVIGPSHNVPMENMASIPDATHYATPLGEVELDTDFLAALRKHPCFGNIPRVHEREHSVQIEVPLLQHALRPFRLVPVVVGRLDRETARKMAGILLELIDENTLVVASSDFTHYGAGFRYVPFREDIPGNLEKLDLGAFEVLKKRDADAFRSFVAEHDATICGREGLYLLLEMLPADAELKLLKYDTSGRIGGSYSTSVSYLSIAILGSWSKGKPVGKEPEGRLSEKERGLLLKLARATLRRRFETGEMPDVDDLGIEITATMREPRAAFVTLHKGDRLRGCIGSIYPSRPLYREVMGRAIDSALRDSRFPPVKEDELAGLHIEISALTPPKAVDSHEDIVLGRHGIILIKGGRRAVFLPQVAPEQGWDLPETLRHLSNKMGLPADAWQKDASFMVFEAEVFGEPKK